jgi:hypothetical protein
MARHTLGQLARQRKSPNSGVTLSKSRFRDALYGNFYMRCWLDRTTV